MIFRKNILEIRKEYKDLKIKNEDLEMYDEVNKIYEKSEKDNEKIGENVINKKIISHIIKRNMKKQKKD